MNNDVINEAQFGFVDKSNIETALVHLLSTIYKNLEDGKITSAVFYDISKAFDCVDHSIFLNMNKALKMPDNFLNLIEEYFTERKQFVRIGEQKSPQMDINAGIFQGSIFGPKAFIFYINGIFKLNLRGKVQLYADDTILAYAENSLADLKLAIEHDLRVIRFFFHSLKLDLNATKMKYIIFNSRKHFENFTDTRLDVLLDGINIERVEFYKCLGLVLDERLNFNKHIDSVYNKCIPMMYAIKRARYYLTEKILYQIYFAHIYSHFIFLNPIWSCTTKHNLDRLFVIQKKCLRFIQNKPPLSDSLTLFSSKIPPSIKNNIALRYISDIHSHGTRQSLSGNFYVIGFKTKYGDADFYRRGLIRYNELNSDLKSIRTITLFKGRLKQHLYEQYAAEN